MMLNSFPTHLLNASLDSPYEIRFKCLWLSASRIWASYYPFGLVFLFRMNATDSGVCVFGGDIEPSTQLVQIFNWVLQDKF